MAERVVIDTGPLIAFARMGALDVIGQMPFEFICPEEIRKELDYGTAQGHPPIDPFWLKVIPLSAPLSLLSITALDEGEAAVIQLSLELGGPRVSIDELLGRRIAAGLGLNVVGSLGLIARAKTLGIIQVIGPLIENAKRQGIHYHPDLVNRVLAAVGE
jgi:predicted nucleic acid-binding protein